MKASVIRPQASGLGKASGLKLPWALGPDSWGPY
jgi:hypothetical protein